MDKTKEALLYCNFEKNCDTNDGCDELKLIWNGDWASVLAESENVIFTECDDNLDSADVSKLLTVGIASLSAFCEANWTGPTVDFNEIIKKCIPNSSNSASELTIDGVEIYSTTLFPELLLNSINIFKKLPDDQLINCLWKLRCYHMHQKVLEEQSFSLLTLLENLCNKLEEYEKDYCNDSTIKSLIHLEINQVYLTYGKVQKSEEFLNKIKNQTGFLLELKGALGKRTKYQQEAVAQLSLDVKINQSDQRLSANETHSDSCLLVPHKLQDDVRLENIQYLDIKENNYMDLTAVEQTICINTIQYIQRSQPKDSLADEELLPYINILLAQKDGPWAVRICALLIKCKLESNNKRTVERAMMQCEEIVNNFYQKQPNVTSRLSYIWASGLPLSIHWRSQLADLLLSVGLVKASLELYLHLELWEEVVACYTILELRHKAAEIIQQQLKIKPTVKLYCLLGDATDDITLYEKAWNFSEHKSGRAQRHWGNFLFSRKKYEECIPHYQKSCEINSLQESVWIRLGYAALSIRNWELAATAYRRYTYLEPHSFEAWNNLAKAYVEQGNKPRAYKALNEALKYNYDNWKVWENMIIVSLDTGHFDDVIRGYHRVLDLHNKHHDIEVLTLLVKGITESAVDADGNPTHRLIPKTLELFGRITSIHPSNADIWQLYADLSPNALLQSQRLHKSYGALSQASNWINDPKLCDRFINLAEAIASSSLKASEEECDSNKGQISEILSSARLSIQTVIRVLSKEKLTDYKDNIEGLQNKLDHITTELKKRLS